MTDVRVVVATGCHLCPPAVAAVHAVCAARDVRVQVVDIDGDVELERRYRERIPVVEVNGSEVARFAITEGELAAVLDRTGS